MGPESAYTVCIQTIIICIHKYQPVLLKIHVRQNPYLHRLQATQHYEETQSLATPSSTTKHVTQLISLATNCPRSATMRT